MRQVLKLRAIYGADLSSDIQCDVETEDAADLLIELRPESHLSFGSWATPQNVEACQVFLEYVSKHTRPVAQWAVAAFWWLSLVVAAEASVAELAGWLKMWEQRYRHALDYWSKRATDPPKDRARLIHWWGVYADLKHSASLERDFAREDPVRYRQTSYEVLAGGGWIQPSEVQFGDVDGKAAIVREMMATHEPFEAG